MNIFVSTLLAFLPKRYREGLVPYAVPTSGAIVGGLFETLICLGLLIHRYQIFTSESLAALPTSVMVNAAEKGGESAIMGFGGILMVEYVFQFTTLVLLFLMVEGAIRVIAAIGSGESLPSLPLQMLSFLQGKLETHGHEARMGKRVRDNALIADDGETLQIASCRPKAWTRLTTISYEGGLYELAEEQVGEAPRRFAYVLRKKPVSAVIRGLYSYDPDEALR